MDNPAQTIAPKQTFVWEKYKIWITLAAFLLIYILIFYRLSPKLLFSDTILTGGDTASWYQSAAEQKEFLTKHGRLFGWSISNFFGYNELQHYFCIPFLISVLLSFFMPLTVALKITTILGALTLPVAFWSTVSKITKNFWSAITGAFLSLIFVFNESYTMFGGNLLSTFAGEFSHAISISVFVLFMGFCWESFVDGKRPIVAGILLGLSGLCHLFIFMVAFFMPFFFIFAKFIANTTANKQNDKSGKKSKKANKKSQKDNEPAITFSEDGVMEKILWTYIIAFLVMSFWLVPMIATKKYAQSISMIWNFPNFKDFFIKSFLTLIIIGVLLNLALMIASKAHRLITTFIGYMYLVCGFFYIVSTYLEIPDIRFIPPALIMSILAITVSLSYIPESKDESDIIKTLKPYYYPAVAILCAVGISIFIYTTPKTTTGWYNWNYTGYEAKAEWHNLEGIIKQYGGDDNTGRILWEKQNQNDNKDFGSERAFENLHLFTGRPSTEGVHYGSSFMARATTYMQSEYSLNPVDPEARRIYSQVNPEGWPTRFYMTNSRDIITYSPEIKKKFESHPDFIKTGEFGKFTIYTFRKFPHSYIRVTDNENLSIIKKQKYGFKTDFYRAFRDYELFDKPFVPEEYAKGLTTYKHFNELGICDRETKYTLYKTYDEYRLNNFDNSYNFDNWISEYKYNGSITEESVNSFDIQFKTTEIGKPHIIGMTYSPNFKSKHGERIYPVSPGFMMIIPKNGDVHIHYGWSLAELLGLLLTLLTIPLIVFYPHLERMRLPAQTILRKTAIGLFSFLVVFFLIISLTDSRKIYSDLPTAERLYNTGKQQQALDIANRYATQDNLEKYDNSLIYDYYYLKIRILRDRRQTAEAQELYEYLRNRFNHSRYNEQRVLRF